MMEITAREVCCRLCFCLNGNFLNIFDEAPFTLDIAEMLKKYFHDEVKLSDPLPNIICSDCWRKTESFHEFHEKVLSGREKYLNLYLDKMAIKKEQESILVTQSQFDGFGENISVEPMTVEPIQSDDNNQYLLHDGHEPLVLDCILKGDDELSAIDDNGSNLDYYCITKTDYQFETNSWSGEGDIQDDFDENSNDEHFADDNDDDNDDKISVNEQPEQDNSSLPTNIKHLSTSQIQEVVTKYFDMNCDKCKTIFSGFDEAKSHYQFAHNIARGYVKCCDLKLKEHKNYRGHILWHLNPNVFDCLICGSSYKTLQSYHAHKHFHKNRALKRFICDICNAKFAIKPKLIHHIMQVHAAKKKYFCEECGKSFRTENQFNVHNRYVHSGLDTQLDPERIEEIIRTKFDMKCELKPCEKVFESLQDAKQHYLNVHNISNGWIKCCNNKFKFNKETNDHIAWHINPTVFQCPDCGKLCTNRNQMNKHMVGHGEKKTTRRTHLEHEDLYECEHCDKTFPIKFKLIEHMKFIHEPEIQKVKEAEWLSRFFDMTCDRCDNVFDSLDEALTHYIQEHNDQNGYIKCCDLQFSEMSLVKDHIKWHLDPNIFKCSQCNEKLPTRKTLQSHIMATHSPDSFFICDVCDKRYTVKEKLKRHILSTHLNYRMQCGLCDEKFENFKRLQAHLESTHLDDLNSIETDIKKIHLLDLNDERIKAAMRTFVDQTCEICHVKLDTLADARTHYLNEHQKPKGYFKCCKSKLKFETSLIDHLNWHVNPKIFRCRLCCKVLGGRNSIVSHVKSHQAMHSKRFSCAKCSEVFPRIEKYRMHMDTKHGVTVPKRRIARNESPPNSFADAIDNEEEEEEEEEDPNWDVEKPTFFDMTCNVKDCAIVFSSLANARKHYNRAHNNPNGFIKCCDIKLRTSYDVKEHIAWHKDRACFKCEECGREFKLKRALLRHAESHTANFHCNRCDKKYTRKTTLVNHMLWHENREKKLKFFCVDCNRSYYSEASLRAHRDRTHTITESNNSFICEFCALSFRTVGLLKSHARTVHKQGPQKPKQKFKCDICLNFYASKGILRTHKLTHAEKRFNCKLCRKVSPTAAALDLHMKAVHVEAKYKCHLCEKSFKLAPALKDHIATHLNDKQYKCTYCDEEFIWRTNMYKHRKRIHKKEWEADRARKEAEKKML